MVSELRGVGPQLAELLNKLGIHTWEHLLFHLPFRYEDRTCVTPIISLTLGQPAQVEAEVLSAHITFGRRRSLQVLVDDGSGTLTLQFFYFSTKQREAFIKHACLRLYGEPRRGKHGWVMMHPEYQWLQSKSAPLSQHLTPIYPTTEGITQKRLRSLMQECLSAMSPTNLPDPLQTSGVWSEKSTLCEALKVLHSPDFQANGYEAHDNNTDEVIQALQQGHHWAQKRLLVEELLAHQLSLMAGRARAQIEKAPVLPAYPSIWHQWRNALPFELTGAQTRTIEDISQDLSKCRPMMRLVQGDVGSGKTAVAASALIQAVAAGYQAALMAPTDLLVEQHSKTLRTWFEPLGIQVGTLSGQVRGKKRTQTLSQLESGQLSIIVGTHALFQADVFFARLALVVVDEQHRFGVDQRLALRHKGLQDNQHPHQLVLTATPIPRTLSMSFYADLPTSIIDELPKGRQPITTVALPDNKRASIKDRVKSACENGRQCYWVCTLIEENEEIRAQAAEKVYEDLVQTLKPLRVGLIHGRLKAEEKQEVMQQFKTGDLDILVATTVIEVGVDVPNASLMVIENAERLGLAQLHQLRGRIGRGAQASHCVLMYQSPLSNLAQARLQTLKQTQDGFAIAEKDLQLRGPGEVLGTKQTGLAQFRVADLLRDAKYLPQVRQMALAFWQNSPEQVPLLIERWLSQAHQYDQV